MLNGFDLGFEHVTVDDLPALGKGGCAVQFGALGNRQELKQVVTLCRVRQHFVYPPGESVRAVELFDSTQRRVKERRLGG
ncbi:UNVERIFIED_ORG: hypothetical protein J2Y77_001636 [Pseudomonas lini]